jgi:hypothetical protein
LKFFLQRRAPLVRFEADAVGAGDAVAMNRMRRVVSLGRKQTVRTSGQGSW